MVIFCSTTVNSRPVHARGPTAKGMKANLQKLLPGDEGDEGDEGDGLKWFIAWLLYDHTIAYCNITRKPPSSPTQLLRDFEGI